MSSAGSPLPRPRPPQLEPGATPPRTVVGTRCQDDADPGAGGALHDGCPGWWSGFDGSAASGVVCRCECHARGAGWPGWEAHPEFVGDGGSA